MTISYMAIPAIQDEWRVFKDVCKFFNKSPEKVLEKNNTRENIYVVIRQISITLFIIKLGLSLKKAGGFFNKDKATTLHSRDTIINLIQTNYPFRESTSDLFEGIDITKFVKRKYRKRTIK